ncbi:MAG TPA: YciI family protein [Longimicrobiales bacterium]|nr:YciI family protein [Longimicrobiales bacterium]
MRYTLLLHYPEMTEEQLGEEAWEQGKAAFHSYAEALDEADVLVSAEVLQPSSSTTTLRRRNGKVEVQDGPFADTKEQLGGTFVIDVPDLDAALAWAERCPAAEWGSVEVRPSAVRFTKGSWILAS